MTVEACIEKHNHHHPRSDFGGERTSVCLPQGVFWLLVNEDNFNPVSLQSLIVTGSQGQSK
jgi:hypothetical protein